MKLLTTDRPTLAIAAGGLILAAATNVNVLVTGGYLNAHAGLVSALAVGVFVAAYALPHASRVTPWASAVIVICLIAGEIFSLSQTAERIVIAREAAQAPLKAAQIKREEAITALASVETSGASSARLTLAIAAEKAAKAKYETELREGGRCKTICNGLREDAERATAEKVAAAKEAAAMRADRIEEAKTVVAANPTPPSATPLADRLGVPAWALDLAVAALLSIAATGLAAALISYGSSATLDRPATASDSAGQSDFPTLSDEEIADVRAVFHRPTNVIPLRPDNPPNGSPNGSGPKGGRRQPRKIDVLADIQSRIESGERFASQEDLRAALNGSGRHDFTIAKSTLSEWLGELGGSIVREQVGRRKVVG